MFTFALLFAVHNVIRHTHKNKAHGKLVILFYVLAITLNVTEIIFYSMLISDPNKYQPYFTKSFRATMVLDWMTCSVSFAIGCLFLVQMYQLNLSLRHFLSFQAQIEVRRRKKVVYWIASIAALLFFVIQILEYIFDSKNDDNPRVPENTMPTDNAFAYTCFYFVLLVTYSITLYHLNWTLTRMNDFSSCREAKKEVITQFSFFLVAFIIQLLAQVPIFIGRNWGNCWSIYTYLLIEASIHYVLDFIPISYMLYCHHKAFMIQFSSQNTPTAG